MRAKICVFDRDLAKTYSLLASNTNLGVTPNQLCEIITNLLEVSNSLLRDHSEKVAVISYMLSLELSIPPKVADLIQVAGYIHDLGMLSVSSEVLNGAKPLSYQEINLIKKHPLNGANCFKHIKLFNGKGGVVDMVLYHHERWDGSGYPFGLKGEEIPLGARILAVADTLTALTDGYLLQGQKAVSFDTALEIVKKGSGVEFDPIVVSALLTMEDKVRSWLGYC